MHVYSFSRINCVIYFLVALELDSSTRKPTIAHNQQNRTHVISAPLCQWSSVLSGVVMEQERMLHILLDLLDTNNDMELRPLTGLLKNLARHSSNKDHMGKALTV